MARYALIKHDGTVDSVILAEPDFFSKVPGYWREQYAEWVEIETTAVIDPGARYDRNSRQFTPPPASGETQDAELRSKVREILQDEGVLAPAPTPKGT